MCDQAEKQRLYKEIWQRVKGVYCKRFCVSERGLQAALYTELQKELSSDSHVVVEPTWDKGRPDLVIVEERKITDIFELKFVPHNDVKWEEDIKKLFRYIKKRGERYPVCLDPKTGQWEDSLPVQDGCLLHFAVVARHDAEAVWPDDLKKEVRKWNTDNEKWNHWFGRTGTDDGEWGYCQVKWNSRVLEAKSVVGRT